MNELYDLVMDKEKKYFWFRSEDAELKPLKKNEKIVAQFDSEHLDEAIKLIQFINPNIVDKTE